MDLNTAPYILAGMALLGFIIALLVLSPRWQRRASFRKVALHLGLTYAPQNRALMRKYRYLDRIAQSLHGPIRDIVGGVYRGYPVHAFHYTYSKSAAVTASRRECCFLLEQDRRFPELRVYPVRLSSRALFTPGLPAITMGPSAFAQSFAIYGKDRQFAQLALHGRMMSFLLQHPELALIFEDSAIIIAIDKPLESGSVQHYLDILVQIRQLMPESLYESG